MAGMKPHTRKLGLFTLAAFLASILAIGVVRAGDPAPAADDPHAAKLLALPSAGKFALDELFKVTPAERFNVEFRKANVIHDHRRVEVPGSKFIWAVDPTIVGVDGINQVCLEGYNPAEAHGKGICDIRFTLRSGGLWLFVVYGDQSDIGCVEVVEERDKLIFLATTRKDGKVQGALFNPYTAKDLGDLRRDKEAGKHYDQYVDPILALFKVGVL